MMVVNVYCIMHNEDYFPDPFRFQPERWLDEASSENLRRAFVPFGTGKAACLGKGMAYLETSLVVAKTLWYFEFSQAPGKAGSLGGGGLRARIEHDRGQTNFSCTMGLSRITTALL